MRLPDFVHFELLNRLKQQMGISADEFGSFAVTITPGGLTIEERARLGSGDGIEVSWDDLTVLANGTLAYKDSRVLLYIRDVTYFGDDFSEPRYHVATCRTIESMHSQRRIERYVIATEPNGVFRMNILTGGGIRTERKRLRVCQNCLDAISFNGFGLYMQRRQRMQYVNDFTPEQFFAQYPQSPHTRLPSHNSEGAPLNDYTKDFPAISRKLREEAGWRCSAPTCRRILAAQALRRYLQVHHIDGNRWNNDPTNLKVVCIACHAEENHHSHIKASPDYVAYMRIRPAAAA